MTDVVLKRVYPSVHDWYHGFATYSEEEEALIKRKLEQAVEYEKRAKALGLM